MSTLVDKTITGLRSNHDKLAARVRGFDEEDLARQSGSCQCDVAQVLGHLGSGAEIGLATLSGQEADAALEQLTDPLSFMVGFLDALGGTQTTLRVETTDPHRVLGLVLGHTVSLGDAPANIDGVLAGPAEALLRLLACRLDEAHTPDTLTITSDVVTLDQLRRVFPGI
jgi:DinB superfamily